ncbi:phage filamentation protein Fil family protein [Erwinia amylovora]
MASLLTHGCQVTHYRHSRGWIETPDGRYFQPNAINVHFLKGCRKPLIARHRRKPRWFARLMGVFA